MTSSLAAALALVAGLSSAPSSAMAPAAGFRSISYDVALTPDFAGGVVTGVERLRFQSRP